MLSISHSNAAPAFGLMALYALHCEVQWHTSADCKGYGRILKRVAKHDKQRTTQNAAWRMTVAINPTRADLLAVLTRRHAPQPWMLYTHTGGTRAGQHHGAT